MKRFVTVICLFCLSVMAQAAEGEREIIVDRNTFSDIYPAVWFSPSTGEIAALTERSEVPPEEKYEIWIEPRDPEFAYQPGKKPVSAGFAMLGKGKKVFDKPEIPQEMALKLKLTHLIKEAEGSDGLVFYCKGKQSECLIMITVLDKKEEVIAFKWKRLRKQQ